MPRDEESRADGLLSSTSRLAGLRHLTLHLGKQRTGPPARVILNQESVAYGSNRGKCLGLQESKIMGLGFHDCAFLLITVWFYFQSTFKSTHSALRGL